MSGISKKGRTEYSMEITFTSKEGSETIDVYIPFDVFCDALCDYSENIWDVRLDGTNTDVWNLFAQFDGVLDEIAENESFLEKCKEYYSKSNYYDEDYDEWHEEYLEYLTIEG